VIKADGYGLGAADAALTLARAGARTFFTASFGEALDARKILGPGPTIFVLNGPTAEDVADFEQAVLTPVLNSPAQIALWGARGPAALHLDTGMNRLGLSETETDAANGLHPILVISHLACSSTPDHPMNARQLQRFTERARAFPGAKLSLAATAGALLGPDYHFDMIRTGIGLYGSGGLDAGGPQLAVAARIDAPILQIRDIAPGESFGYGAIFTAKKPMRTATVGIGYADGFLRSFTGRGYGVLAGAVTPVLGRVSMDLTIIDVTDCACAPGDWVEFLGPHARLDDVAAAAGTAPYEILTTFAGAIARAGGRI